MTVTTQSYELRSDERSIDRFSWHRVLLVARYYGPKLTMQLLIYAAISFVLSVILSYAYITNKPMMVVMPQWVLTWMIIFSPLVFGRQRARAIEIGLPVKWSETAAFMLIYTMLIAPVTVLLLPLVASLTFGSGFDFYSSMFWSTAYEGMDMPEWFLKLSIFQVSIYTESVTQALICLWLVLVLRHNVIIKSVLLLIGLELVYVLSVSIASGLVMYFRIKDTFDGVAEEMISDSMLRPLVADTVSHLLKNLFIFGNSAKFVIIVVMITLVCRKLKRRQL